MKKRLYGDLANKAVETKDYSDATRQAILDKYGSRNDGFNSRSFFGGLGTALQGKGGIGASEILDLERRDFQDELAGYDSQLEMQDLAKKRDRDDERYEREKLDNKWTDQERNESLNTYQQAALDRQETNTGYGRNADLHGNAMNQEARNQQGELRAQQGELRAQQGELRAQQTANNQQTLFGQSQDVYKKDNDPNSEQSKFAKAIMKQNGITVGDDFTFNQLKELSPALAESWSREYQKKNIDVQQEALQYQRELEATERSISSGGQAINKEAAAIVRQAEIDASTVIDAIEQIESAVDNADGTVGNLGTAKQKYMTNAKLLKKIMVNNKDLFPNLSDDDVDNLFDTDRFAGFSDARIKRELAAIKQMTKDSLVGLVSTNSQSAARSNIRKPTDTGATTRLFKGGKSYDIPNDKVAEALQRGFTK